MRKIFALAERTPAVYTTEADKQTAIIPGLTHEQRHQVNACLSVNEVSVKNRVVSYRRRDIETAQLLGIFPLDLPEETLETKAFIIQLSAEFRDQLRNQQHGAMTPTSTAQTGRIFAEKWSPVTNFAASSADRREQSKRCMSTTLFLSEIFRTELKRTRWKI